MTVTDSDSRTARSTRDINLTENGSLSHRVLRETKPSPKTTEIWFMIAGIVLLAVIYNAAADTSLNLFRACLLGTVLAASYIVSRGFAKAGSHDDYAETRQSR